MKKKISFILIIVFYLLSCSKYPIFEVKDYLMEPNLIEGEILKVDTINKNYDYGDIVVINAEFGFFISRVVGLPKDTIQVKDYSMIINGIPNKILSMNKIHQNEDEIIISDISFHEYKEIFPNKYALRILIPSVDRGKTILPVESDPVVVGEDELFIMYDNRLFYSSNYNPTVIKKSTIMGKIIEEK